MRHFLLEKYYLEAISPDDCPTIAYFLGIFIIAAGVYRDFTDTSNIVVHEDLYSVFGDDLFDMRAFVLFKTNDQTK